jgi:hypothetical protein
MAHLTLQNFIAVGALEPKEVSESEPGARTRSLKCPLGNIRVNGLDALHNGESLNDL